jgi:hypothetical protein
MYSSIPIHWNIKSAPASPGRSRAGPSLYVFSLLGFTQKPFIDRPAALSAASLSWLGRRIWNLGEGGPLCTKQASQRSRFCTATDRLIAVQNLLRWLACFVHNRPPSLKYPYSLNTSSLGLSSLWYYCNEETGLGQTICHVKNHREVSVHPASSPTVRCLIHRACSFMGEGGLVLLWFSLWRVIYNVEASYS